MVYNPVDTGIFINTTYTVSGCDTNFLNTIVYQKLGVQIIYDINNIGSADLVLDGNITPLPFSKNYWYGENISIEAQITSNDWLFSNWQSNTNPITPSSTSIIATFNAINSDSVILLTYERPPTTAFISGNDTICDNGIENAEVSIAFIGVPPYSFTYSIDGVLQSPVNNIYDNPYIISTKKKGTYKLQYFSDANEIGNISGQAMVTVLDPPIANFKAIPDSMTILYTTVELVDQSIGDITNWEWYFGDNSNVDYSPNPFHTYNDSIATYEVTLIVEDEAGCLDTTSNILTVTDDSWIYIPNSFTPDNDQLNDRFCISYHGIRESSFVFNIYNRFSELVYSTNNIYDLNCAVGWDGRNQITGAKVPTGVYIYEIYYQDFEGWKHKEINQLIIAR